MPARPIAFVTYPERPALTEDDALGAAALARRGLEVSAVPWSAQVDWRRYDAVVLRSCWDYFLHPAAFAQWLSQLERSGVTTFNPVPLLRWNLHKGYLAELAARAVRIVPTAFLEQGARVQLPALLAERGWKEAVVKPLVSAGAYETWRTTGAGEDGARFAAALARGGLLVQPFLEEISTQGEWSLLFYGGRFSHAVLKRPAAGDFRVQQHLGGSLAALPPPPGVRQAAQGVLALAPAPPLYARVDGVLVGGAFHLMELELLEPVLYFGMSTHAAEAFAEALAGVLPPR